MSRTFSLFRLKSENSVRKPQRQNKLEWRSYKKRSNSGLRYFVLHNLLLVISTRLHIVSYLNNILSSILVHIQLANQKDCNFGKSVVMVISKPRRQSEQCQSSCLQIETKRQRNTLVNRLTGKTGIHTYLSKYFCSVSRLVSNFLAGS